MTNSTTLGQIQSVDTGTVTIKIHEQEKLDNLQINHLIKIRSTNSGEYVIALISKIMRRGTDVGEDQIATENLVKANLIGTWHAMLGDSSNVFKRSLEVVPSIGSESHLLENEELRKFMGAVSYNEQNQLSLGVYTIQKDTPAFLDGNKFFQRHATIVGGTGSGKS